MWLITVSLEWSAPFSRKNSFSPQNNHRIRRTRSNLLKFSAQYGERGKCSVKFIPSLWSPHHHYPRFIYLFHFQLIFFNRSPILNPRSPILIFQQTLDERQFSSMCLKTVVASFASGSPRMDIYRSVTTIKQCLPFLSEWSSLFLTPRFAISTSSPCSVMAYLSAR